MKRYLYELTIIISTIKRLIFYVTFGAAASIRTNSTII